MRKPGVSVGTCSCTLIVPGPLSKCTADSIVQTGRSWSARSGKPSTCHLYEKMARPMTVSNAAST